MTTMIIMIFHFARPIVTIMVGREYMYSGKENMPLTAEESDTVAHGFAELHVASLKQSTEANL